MALHATLSPSSAERWIACPASIRMAESVPPETESTYAREGTAAHALAELMARHQILEELKLRKYSAALREWRIEYDISDDAEAEMTEHGQGYVDYLRARLDEIPDGQLLLEQRLPTGIPDSWGTSDAILVSPIFVESVDFKYGLGVQVEAVGNPQLRLYGVGALEAYGDLLGDVETVRLTVYQPRLAHVAHEELTAAELREWRDSLLPIAAAALGPDAPFGPSEDACRWCPASGSCMAQLEWATARDFGVQPEHMDDDELAAALDAIPFIKQWATAVEAYALNRAYSEGKPIPGYKVVISGGRRSVTGDVHDLVVTAQAAGYQTADVAVLKPKGIGDLEKTLKGDFAGVAAPFITKSTGSPSLVPDTDNRPAINPESQAAEDFAS